MENVESDDERMPRKKKKARISEVQRLLLQTAGGRFVRPDVGGYNSISVENVMDIEEPRDVDEDDDSDYEEGLYSDNDSIDDDDEYCADIYSDAFTDSPDEAMEEVEEDDDTGTEAFNEKYDTTNWAKLGKMSNKILSYPALVSAIEGSLVCGTCASKDIPTASKLNVTENTVGIATTLFITCKTCDREDHEKYVPIAVRPDRLDSTTDDKFELGGYVINVLCILLMYSLGIGIEGFARVLGYLGVRPSVGSDLHWRALENTMFSTIEKVSKACMLDNIKAELLAVKEKLNGGVTKSKERFGLFTSWDMGWQKRSSGRAYNSPSGVGFLLGGYTKKVLCLSVFSKICATCTADTRANRQPTEHRCPKNHTGSSKSMESIGALQCVKELYDKTEDCYVCGICTDDDTCTRGILSHSFREKYPTDRTKWPRKENGTILSDPGKLPLSMPEVQFKYADKVHRKKCYGSGQYNIEKTDEQLKKPECERLKRNFGLCLYQKAGPATGKTMAEFKTGITAVLEHTFNNHEYCSKEWCKFMTDTDAELDDIDTKSRFLDKTKGETYDKMKKLHDSHTTPEKLEQLFHDFSSQKNETMNKKMTVTAPKDKTFCTTMSLTSRTQVVSIRDSVGELEAVKRILQELGYQRMPPSTREFLIRADKLASYHKTRREKADVKVNRNKAKTEKLRTELQKQEQDRKRGFTYESGIALRDDVEISGNAAVVNNTVRKGCKCGSFDHQRSTHKNCPLNTNNKK
jgi:hypothetical protein